MAPLFKAFKKCAAAMARSFACIRLPPEEEDAGQVAIQENELCPSPLPPLHPQQSPAVTTERGREKAQQVRGEPEILQENEDFLADPRSFAEAPAQSDWEQPPEDPEGDDKDQHHPAREEIEVQQELHPSRPTFDFRAFGVVALFDVSLIFADAAGEFCVSFPKVAPFPLATQDLYSRDGSLRATKEILKRCCPKKGRFSIKRIPLDQVQTMATKIRLMVTGTDISSSFPDPTTTPIFDIQITLQIPRSTKISKGKSIVSRKMDVCRKRNRRQGNQTPLEPKKDLKIQGEQES